MQLHDLLGAIDVLEVLHDAPVDVVDVVHDSRSVRPGDLFCCIPGALTDGHEFAAAAIERGAGALLVERRLDPEVPQVLVPSVRRAIGPLAARIHGDPSQAVAVVGVTGTNGKTTTTFLIESIVACAGLTPATIGTLGIRFAGRTEPLPFTTPEAPELQRTLGELRARGAEVIAMEVSSHALAEHRVDGTHFAAMGFTNLTHDHLDYHGSFDEYAAAKARLFTREFGDRCAVNVDDAFGETLAAVSASAGLDVVTFGMDRDARVSATDIIGDGDGSSFRLSVDGDAVDLRIGLPGRFNVANALAATAIATSLGIDVAAIALGLERADPVPGRFEPVGSGAPVAVIVDYAHTPEGIAAAADAARLLGEGRLIIVFGCGGDRDRAKRALMGVAAGRGADHVVLTTDNPRSEDPATIAELAADGLRSVGADFTIELDRRLAIRAALRVAGPGDTVLILGKGAETEQQIGTTRLPFDDRVVAAQETAARWN